MKPVKKRGNASDQLIENLKKATNGMIILALFSMKPMNLDEIKRYLDEKSNSVCKITYPYAAIYRMLDSGYIKSCEKKQATNQRRRKYYTITPKSQQYLQSLRASYKNFNESVDHLLESVNLQKVEQGDLSGRSKKY